MGKEISFWWDAEKRIRVARAGEKRSLFYEAYRQALAGVAEIVRASAMHEHNYTYDSFFSKSKQVARREGVGNTAGVEDDLRIACDSQYLYDYPNNMIVFSGERGAGKSSAMLTFVSSLKDSKGLLFQDEFLSAMVACELPNVDAPAVKRMLQTCRFLDLAPIDPTVLEKDGQILTVILARMFRLAASIWEEGPAPMGRESSARRLDEKNQLIQKFSTCYEHIQAIKKGSEPKPEYEGLDTLAELGDSSCLKVELYGLVGQLLKFCCPEAGEFSYLVLQIDDTDMNIKQAYAILEDIRRYLVIPRVIIIMAADLKHLMQVVESSLLKDYNKGLGSRQEYVEKITHQYITKLFPQTRQINLPALGTYFKEHTENITIRYRTPEKDILPDEKKQEFPSPQDQIFRLIYRKTGMVFLKREHRLHPIIPCNMRLLAHFLSMLIQMEDVEDPDAEEPCFFLKAPDAVNTYDTHREKLRTRLQNVQRFRHYFLDTWAINSLSDQSVRVLRELERIDVADRIRYICVQLNEREKSPLWDRYADMVARCRDIIEHSWDEDLKRLAFALQTYCSLLAHTLALEDLIDYYDDYALRMRNTPKADGDTGQSEGCSQYDSDNTGLGCSFSRLYLLFGSRLFPYHNGSRDEAIVVKLSPTGSDKKENNRQALRVTWFLETRPSFSACLPKLKQCGTLLYSMAADYQVSGSENGIWLDLIKPITNCLYVGDKNGCTPFSAAIPDADSLTVDKIGLDNWHSMGNSALTTVLNCDVQMKMGAALLEIIRASEPAAEPDGDSTNISYEEWINSITDLYTKMAKSLGELQPIAFLKKIDFSGWLKPLKAMSVEASENPEQWKDIISNLSAGVTYKLPPKDEPETESAPEDGSEHQGEDKTTNGQAKPESGEQQTGTSVLEKLTTITGEPE